MCFIKFIKMCFIKILQRNVIFGLLCVYVYVCMFRGKKSEGKRKQGKKGWREKKGKNEWVKDP